MTLAFHNDPALAAMVRAQVDAHTAADEIVQGRYWENGKGCFIGCLAHSDSADKVQDLTGFPVMLTRIAEGLFEGLDNATAKGFPQAVIAAPPVGADLSLVPWQFLHWCVTDALRQYADPATQAACAPAVRVLADKAQGVPVTADAARAADAAARAADAAYAAAHAAARAARAADAAHAAARAARAADAADATAAYAAAHAAAHAAAYAAAHAAYAAARAADAAAARAAAHAAARAAADAAAYAAAHAAAHAARKRQADKLIELLAAAPIKGA